jgi:acetyl esterase
LLLVLLKQRGHGSLLKSQILLYPATANDRDDYGSYHTYGNGGYILTIPELTMMAAFYHEEQFKLADGRNPGPKSALNAPLLATDDELKGLPPCLTITAECDLLRDEGEHYARRLTDAGVETCTVRVIGAVHGFFTLAPIPTPGDPSSETTPQYRQFLGLIANYLKA